MENLAGIAINWAMALLTVIGAASVAAAAIAPLTKTDKDDKIARLLKKAHAVLSKLAFNPRV